MKKLIIILTFLSLYSCKKDEIAEPIKLDCNCAVITKSEKDRVYNTSWTYQLKNDCTGKLRGIAHPQRLDTTLYYVGARICNENIWK